jgi:lipopolysaccharide/colanic/teichoic acid biosynthesis glycosyltransferase
LRRVDRCSLPFALILVKVADGGHDESIAVWDDIIAATAAATRASDVLGWIETKGALGVLLPDIEGARANRSRTVAVELEQRVRCELVRRLGVQALRACSVRGYVDTDPTNALEAGHWSLELFLPALASAHRQVTIYDTAKRALDIVIALGLLLVFSPLLALIAIVVTATSRGPVLFRQRRLGHTLAPFTLFKFRTMLVDANDSIHRDYMTSFIHADERARRKDGIFKITDDPRVTPVGRFLRKTSLDELPQLWNVLRGDMSLVGPRPAPAYEVKQYKRWHCSRILRTKPGLTGLWQVTGRSRTSFDDMVRLDLKYAKTRSFMTDLKILLETPAEVICGRGGW